MESSLGDEQRSRLRAAKLAALLRSVAPGELDDAKEGPFPDGATLIVDGSGWVLDENPGPRSLGPALTWAVHRGVSSLDLVVSADAAVAGHLARRSTYFSLPITVWRIEGTAMVRQAPAPPPQPVAPPRADALVDLLSATGLDVVVEDGVVKGEYLGLELARIVDGNPDPVLEVGIGRFDREIGSMMHAGQPQAATLERARDLVARHRVRHAAPHPLRDLMVSRWVRHDVMADPSTVGALHLEPLESTVAVANLKDPAPAAAMGVLESGGDVVVVCSGEPDLDLVPVAADIAATRAGGASLVLAVADRHLSAIQRRVAAAMIDPPRIVAVDPPF